MGEGEDSIGRHNGHGVTSRHFEPMVVWDAARWDGGRDFGNLPHSMVFPLESWRHVMFGRWNAQADFLRRALMLGSRTARPLEVAKGRSPSARLNTACR